MKKNHNSTKRHKNKRNVSIFFKLLFVVLFCSIIFNQKTLYSQTFPDINNDTTYLHTIPVSQAGTLTKRLYMDTIGLNGLIDDMLYDNRNYERYYSKYGVMLRFNSKYFINNIPNVNLPNYNTQDTLVVNFLNNFKTKYGKFYLEDNYTSPNTIGIDFHLSFDSIVNINSVLRYFEQNNQVINSFKSIIYPVKTLYIPNDRSLKVGITSNYVQYSNSNFSFWGKGFNFGWHHYSLKTPIAWDISQGKDDIVLVNYDAFHGDLPITNSNLTDVKNRDANNTDGNWLKFKTNDITDGDPITHGKQSYPVSGGPSEGHGLSSVSAATSYLNNDNLLFPSPTGGHVGTAPKSSALALRYSSSGFNLGVPLNNELQLDDIHRLDVDFQDNTPNKINRITAYNSSTSTTQTIKTLKSIMKAGIVCVAPAGNDIYGRPSLMGDGAINILFDNGNSSDSRHHKSEYDYKPISVAGLSGGLLYDANCNPWGGVNKNAPPAVSVGERFASGWNYSPGIDKFNIDQDSATRTDAKKNAFVDVVAPATGVTTISGMTTVLQKDLIIDISNNGTSLAAPYVQGIVGLMSSVNRFMGEPLNADGTPIEGMNVQKKFYDIITFTADKVIDDGSVPSGHVAVIQPNYLLQNNDQLKRWWAQRMGFGKVNAYRSVAHSIANKAPFEITTSTLPFAANNGSGDSRGYVNPDGKQLMHMGSKVKEGVVIPYNGNNFWLMNINRGPTIGNDGVLNVLEYGGVSLPFINGYHNNSDADLTNNHANYNNQGVTLINNSTQELKLKVNADKILAIDGMLIGTPGILGHDITTGNANNTDGLILVEGYIRDVELVGNLRVGDLILDGSTNGGKIGASCLWFGNSGTKSEVYGKVAIVNDGMFMGGGGETTFLPGAKIMLLGKHDIKLRFGSDWHLKGGSEFIAKSSNRKLIVEGGSKLYIDREQNVDLNLEVVIKSCAEFIIERDALLRIKKLIVEPGGTLTIKEGAHITLEGTNHQFKGINNFEGTSANKILFRANTARNCLYENNVVIGTTTIDFCSPYINDNNKVTMHSSVSINNVACTFPCPSNSNWFVLESKKGGNCPDPTQCQITNKLNIPDEYLCSGIFTHIKSETILNGVSTMSIVNIYAGETVIPLINRCISNNSTYTVKIYLMRSSNDPTPCILTQTVTCECGCPTDTKNWANVTAAKSGGGCAPNECFVEHSLTIPASFPCYTLFKFESKLEGAVTNSTGFLPTNGANLSTYNRCIPEGSNYTMTIKLYKNSSDTEPCIITKSVFCELTPVDNTPCLPDCFTDLFTPRKDIFFFLPNCPQCIVKVSYSSRKACTVWQDIQITTISKMVVPGAPSTACDGCSDSEIYKLAIQEIIKNNEMGFEPINEDDPCSIQWRVSQATCWASWQKVITSQTGGETRTITINKPCNSDCCLRLMKVCRFPGGGISIEDLGPITSGTCSDVNYTIPYPPFQVINCTNTCDMLEDINEVFYKTSTENNDINYDNLFNNVNPNEKVLEYNVSNNNDILKVIIDKTNVENIEISIYDINGGLLFEKTNKTINGNTEFVFNINNLLTGTYIINIVADGLNMKSSKFQIVK